MFLILRVKNPHVCERYTPLVTQCDHLKPPNEMEFISGKHGSGKSPIHHL